MTYSIIKHETPVLIQLGFSYKKRGRPRKNGPTWSRYGYKTFATKIIKIVTEELKEDPK